MISNISVTTSTIMYYLCNCIGYNNSPKLFLQISEDRLKDFLKTAETLQVRGLAESCATAVTSSATVNGDDDMAEGDDEVSVVANRHSSALRRRRIR